MASFTHRIQTMIMPTLLDRYIIKQLVDFFITAIVIFSLIVFFSDTLFDFIHDVLKYGVPFPVLLTIIGLQLPKSMALVLPASTFLAVLMVYNRMNSDFELISFRMNGISLKRLVKPAIWMGLIASLLTYILYGHVVPFCNAQTEALRQKVMESGELPFGRESFMHKNYDKNHNLVQMIYIGKYIDNELGASTIIDLSKPNTMQIVQAHSGSFLAGAGWHFKNANIYVPAKKSKDSSSGHADKFIVKNLMGNRQDVLDEIEDIEKEEQEINIDSDKQDFFTMFQRIQNREKDNLRVSSNSILNMWEKFALPLTCLGFVLCAIPLAMGPPRQVSQRSFVIALAVLFSFYILRSVFSALGSNGMFTIFGMIPKNWSLIAAAWLPLLILCGVGLLMLRRKSTVL